LGDEEVKIDVRVHYEKKCAPYHKLVSFIRIYTHESHWTLS